MNRVVYFLPNLSMGASGISTAAATPGSAMDIHGVPRWESRWRQPIGGIRWIGLRLATSLLFSLPF